MTKHAQASKVGVKLIRENNGLSLTIQDNGKGFNIETVPSREGGLGLLGIRERVRLSQGTYHMTSHADQGSEIRVWVPLVG